jgi:hypothetical protein
VVTATNAYVRITIRDGSPHRRIVIPLKIPPYICTSDPLVLPVLPIKYAQNPFQPRHAYTVAIKRLGAERKVFAVTLFEKPPPFCECQTSIACSDEAIRRQSPNGSVLSNGTQFATCKNRRIRRPNQTELYYSTVREQTARPGCELSQSGSSDACQHL